MIIQHNITALRTVNKLQRNTLQVTSSTKRISSGLRINSAADDSAGLAISEKMRAQIRGLDQAKKNSQDGISLIQTAEGGLATISETYLQRMRELAIQASNDTLTGSDRVEIQREVEQLKYGINEIANGTKFNSISLLNQIVKHSHIREEVISAGILSSVTGGASIPNVVTIEAGVSDQFLFTVKGNKHSFKLNPGTYTREQFIYELNNTLDEESIPLTASYINANKVRFTAKELELSIDDISENGTERLIHQSRSDIKGFAVTGFPRLNPDVSIIAGVNDALTFEIDSIAYSITIAPGTYRVYGHPQSNLNDTSPLLNEINSKLQSEGAPVTAKFQYAANPDPPFYDGAFLYFDFAKSIDGIHFLDDGTHSVNNFGGNAKSIFFDSFLNGWDIENTNQTISGNVGSDPAKYYSFADLTKGVTIQSGVNDTLNFKINGLFKEITLREGEYEMDELLSELNDNFINNSLNLKAYSGLFGNLIIEHTNLLNSDQVESLSGNAVSDLFFQREKGEEPIIEIKEVPSQGMLHFHIGANSESNFEMLLMDVRTDSLGIKDVNVYTRINAEETVRKVDIALQTVLSERAKLGAYQNRLEYTITNLGTSSENLTAAESRIRDIDIAKEYLELTKENILQQTSQALLAQSNQQSEGILELLR